MRYRRDLLETGVSTVELALVLTLLAAVFGFAIVYLKTVVPNLQARALTTLRMEASGFSRPQLGTLIGSPMELSGALNHMSIAGPQTFFSFANLDVASGNPPAFTAEIQGLFQSLGLNSGSARDSAEAGESWCYALFQTTPNSSQLAQEDLVSPSDYGVIDSNPIACEIDESLDCIQSQAEWILNSRSVDSNILAYDPPLLVAFYSVASTPERSCFVREVAAPLRFNLGSPSQP